mgnify:FL=1
MLKTLSRLISLTAAAAVVAVTVFYPRAIAVDGAHVPFGGFVLLIIGMSLAWVHGIGFVPENPWLRRLFSPLAAWPLLVIGAALVFV